MAAWMGRRLITGPSLSLLVLEIKRGMPLMSSSELRWDVWDRYEPARLNTIACCWAKPFGGGR